MIRDPALAAGVIGGSFVTEDLLAVVCAVQERDPAYVAAELADAVGGVADEPGERFAQRIEVPRPGGLS